MIYIYICKKYIVLNKYKLFFSDCGLLYSIYSPSIRKFYRKHFFLISRLKNVSCCKCELLTVEIAIVRVLSCFIRICSAHALIDTESAVDSLLFRMGIVKLWINLLDIWKYELHNYPSLLTFPPLSRENFSLVFIWWTVTAFCIPVHQLEAALKMSLMIADEILIFQVISASFIERCLRFVYCWRDIFRIAIPILPRKCILGCSSPIESGTENVSLTFKI